MRPPFPGMDPYLEARSLWPDFHNRLITAIADAVSPLIAPKYYVGLERRTYLLQLDDLIFVGRPDISVTPRDRAGGLSKGLSPRPTVLEVNVPLEEEVGEMFLEVRETSSKEVVTVLEVLSPANKLHKQGRQDYEKKRRKVFQTRTSLVEVDLLREGDPMPLQEEPPPSDYRILVSPGFQRPRARLLAFSLREPIPGITIPLLPGDREPEVDLGAILHQLYERARFDLQIDYGRPPVPPLAPEDEAWAREILAAWQTLK